MKVEEVEIDDLTTLANFFIDNKNNQFVVESSDFKNARDLYFFCVEITTKILSIKYGDVNGIVNIDQLSIEEIKVVQDLLSNAAIDMEIDIKDIDYNEERTNIIYNIPFNDLENINIKLEDYSTSIQKNNKQYDIKYKIV